MQVKWTQLRDQLGETLAGTFKDLVDGAEADVAAYGQAIAAEMTMALSMGDERMMRHLRGQLKTLAGIHRVRASEATFDTIWAVVGVAFSAATAGVSAAGGQSAGME